MSWFSTWCQIINAKLIVLVIMIMIEADIDKLFFLTIVPIILPYYYYLSLHKFTHTYLTYDESTLNSHYNETDDFNSD